MMKRVQVIERLSYILSPIDMSRIELMEEDGCVAGIRIDVHGWSVRKAETVVSKLITLQRCGFCLTVIHGYHHGTQIKQTLEKFTHARVLSKPAFYNRGITVMNIKAAA